MKQANVVRKYFNKMQRQAMAIGAHDEYIIASRGTGKSEGIDARFILRNVWEMPGSLGALISPSYAKAGATPCPPSARLWPNGAIWRVCTTLSATVPRRRWASACLFAP